MRLKLIHLTCLLLCLPFIGKAQSVLDVNSDNFVNCGDITALYNFILNNDNTYFETSDVNGDGHINAADVTAIYNYTLNQPENTQRRMSFLHISDTHSVDVTLQPALEILNSDSTYSFMVLTGDFLPTETMMQEVLASGKPVFVIPGNHDAWDVGSTANSLGQRGFREQVMNRLYPNGEVVFGDSIGNYFYADVTNSQGCTIRVIGLDLYELDVVGASIKNSVIFSQQQIDWLVDVLEHSSDKDGVVVLTHNGFGNSHCNARNSDYINEFVSIYAHDFFDTYNFFGMCDASLIPSIIEAYTSGNNLTNAQFNNGYMLQKVNVTTNFSGPSNNFIAHYGGHIHFDVVEHLSEFPNQLMSIIAYGGRGKGVNWNDLVKTNTGVDSYTINASNINFTNHEHKIERLGSQKKDDGTLRQQITFNF